MFLEWILFHRFSYEIYIWNLKIPKFFRWQFKISENQISIQKTLDTKFKFPEVMEKNIYCRASKLNLKVFNLLYKSGDL